MRSAKKVMDSKKEMRDEVEKVLGKEQGEKLWRKATSRLSKIYERYSGLSEGERSHTDTKIFPSAAVYLTAKEFMSDEEAYSVIENTAVRICAKAQGFIRGMMKIPFMPSLFIKMWDPMTRNNFGTKCGFENVFYPKEKGSYRMDIIACPYNRYFTELGCPEITKIFCENDERMYGNLPGLVFERTGTLGKGAEKCDFFIRRA